MDVAEEEYERFFREHSSAIMRYALRRWSDIEGCEDVVVDTFLVAWRKWKEKPEPERELPWLYGISFRVLSNHRRSRDRRERLFSRLSKERDEELDDVNVVDVDRVHGALERLKVSDREILTLVYWEELTYREIAQTLGVSENAAGIRITRAKNKLRFTLAQLAAGDDGDDGDGVPERVTT